MFLLVKERLEGAAFVAMARRCSEGVESLDFWIPDSHSLSRSSSCDRLSVCLPQ